MMPKSSKPIALICGSRSLKSVNLDFYLDKDAYSEVICGGTTGVDTLAEQWAKRNHLEFAAFLPQYEIYGSKYAPQKCYEDMVHFCDIVIAFWDGQSEGTKYTIDYARKMGRPVISHLIEER